MDFAAFQTLAGKGAPELPPLLVFHGGEGFLRELGVQTLKEARPDLAAGAVRLPSSETEWPALSEELFTPAFFGAPKLVVVADEGNWLHNHLDDVKAYAKSPSASAVLAILVPSDKSTGLSEGKSVALVDCRTLKPPDLRRWVQALFQRRGRTIERDALELLVQRGGDELAAIAGHVEKLAAYVGERSQVRAADVKALVAGSESHKDYELALACASKKAGRSLELVRSLLDAGEPPTKILWKLAWQYRKMVEAKKLLLAGRRRFEVPSLVQITYYADEFLRLVDGHSLEELLEKHGAILEADLALKTGGAQDGAVMEALAVTLSGSTSTAGKG